MRILDVNFTASSFVTQRDGLNNSSWVAISPPADNPRGVVVKSDASIAIKLDSDSDGGAGNYTHVVGASPLVFTLEAKSLTSASVLFYAQSASGTPNLETIWIY